MGFHLSETWFGEGLVFKRLIIRPREMDGTFVIDGILMDAIPSYIQDKFIDLTHTQSLDEAIHIIRSKDAGWYNALTFED